jgi:membrane-bound lytic murein transglycosylase D
MLNIPVDELTFLNPMYRRHVIPPTKDGYPLVIPKEKIGVFLTNEKAVYEMGQEDLNLAFANQNNLMAETRKTHKVRYGETLGGIASKYRCRVSELRDWNGIRGNLIREGQRLVVYSKQRTASTTASSKTSTPTPKGFHTVKKGDTLWGIAKNTGVTISQLLKLNNISSNATLKVGSRLKIG